MADYMKALQKPFTDLTKLAIGVILSLIPIVNFTIVRGFAIESSGLGKAGKSDKMPEWKDWGDLFMKGLLSVVVAVIYMIPAIAVFVVALGFFIVSLFAGLAGTLTPEMMESGEGQIVSQILQNNWAAVFPALMTAAPMILLGLILGLIASYLTPMAVLHYIKNKSFAKAFAFGEVLHKCLNAEYFVAFIVVLVVSIIAGLVLAWIPLLGAAILNFVLGVFSFSVYGEVYKSVK